MLPVENIEDYSHLTMLRAIYQMFREETDQSVVIVLDETMLDELEAASSEEEGENETTNSNPDEEAEETASTVARSAVSSSGGEV